MHRLDRQRIEKLITRADLEIPGVQELDMMEIKRIEEKAKTDEEKLGSDFVDLATHVGFSGSVQYYKVSNSDYLKYKRQMTL